jgi:hypothetical protein
LRAKSPEFQKLFGEWTEGQMIDQLDTRGVTINEDGEPRLLKKNEQYFYATSKGERIDVNRIKYPEMKTYEAQEVTSNLTYNFVSRDKKADYNYNDPEALNLDLKVVVDSIENSMAEYLVNYPEDGQKVEIILKNKEEFAKDVIDRVRAAGFKPLDDKISKDGGLASEISEDDKISSVNMKDNYETSAKDNANANTKLFLAQIQNVVLEDGKPVLDKSGYLKSPKFVKFDEVWDTILPALADIVGFGNETDQITNVFGQMQDKISALHSAKPWTMILTAKLKKLPTNKRLEFIQAMSNVRLNFNVTEYNSDNNTYTVINATATGSKGSKVRNEWSQEFKSKFIGVTSITAAGVKALNVIQEDLKKSKKAMMKDATSGKLTDFEIVVKHSKSLRTELGNLGIELTHKELMVHVRQNDKTKALNTVNKIYTRMGAMITDVIKKDQFIIDGEYKSPLDNEGIIKSLAEGKGLFLENASEATVLMNEGKMAWTFSTPSYLHNRVNSFKQSYHQIKKMAKQAFNANSRWAKHLAATESIDGDLVYDTDEKRKIQSERRLVKLQVGLAGSFKTKGKNDGVDAKNINQVDAINDTMVKMFGGKTGGKTIFQTIIAADKSKKLELEGFEFFESNTGFNEGNVIISDGTADVFIGYFEDEWNRMKQVQTDIDTLPDSKLISHYHKGNKNGLKSQLFPEFSIGGGNTDITSLLYKDGRVIDNATNKFTSQERKIISKWVKKSLARRVDSTFAALLDNNMISENLDGSHSNISISKAVLDAYKDTPNSLEAVMADYTINGMIANIEYGKVFSGDPSYYKNTIDMIKRIPGTYTDGLQLIIESEEELIMNVAIIDNVEVASSYHKKIKDSLTDKSLAKAYGRINTTDAQAWITPNRWKFLKTKLGQWSPTAEKAYDQMIAGKKLDAKYAKLVMQPLKGVYFGMDDNGVPTYLKYSQAVLIPNMVAGTPMQAIYDKMTLNPETGKPWGKSEKHNEIHEVITLDGIKVGATGSTPVHKPGTTEIADDFVLNKIELSNRNWKLQQDLPVKGNKQMNLGSQIQKNILAELSLNLDTKFMVGDKEMNGQELLDEVHRTISHLSNLGVEKLSKRFGIGEDRKITNKDELYKALVDEFKGRGASENVIAALQKEMPFDAIPQVGNKLQSIFMSIMNKEIVKVQTPGAALIQVSPFGFEKQLDEKVSGIKIVSGNYNPEGLLPPRIEDGVVKPGQAFMPFGAIAKLLPEGIDFSKTSGKDLMKYIDPAALEILTYRIPNQGMSSNDMLEIVGILPEGMGDSIMAWDGIPAKTGSDFDIDKMFAMMPNLHFNKRSGRIEKIPYSIKKKGNKQSTPGAVYQEEYDLDLNDKAASQNRLFDLYKSLLLAPSNYDNMMRSIDESQVKDDIVGTDSKKGLFPEETMESLQIFSPTQQIKTKFEYMSGKFGVAQTANQLVDHISNQNENIRLDTYIGLGNAMKEDSYLKTLKGKELEEARRNKIRGGWLKVTKFDEVYDSEGKNKIADIISEFLNAYVDIAKDPYIARGNHNNMTANTTFMMLRAGVPLNFVNRFIGSPIIKDYVKYKKLSEGKSSDLLKIGKDVVSPIKYLTEKWGITNQFEAHKKSKLLLDNYSASKMEAMINSDELTPSQVNEQSMILSTFLTMEGLGNELAASVQASKADTKGATGSFSGRLISQNRIEDVIKKGVILGFKEKISGSTSLATYTNNAIGWVGDVVDASDIFLPAKTGLEAMFNRISNLATGKNLLNDDLANEIYKAYTSYNMSKLPIFNDISNEDVHKALFEKMPIALEAYKKENKNFLVDNLELKFSGGINYIKLDSRNKTETYQNDMYRAWVGMLESSDPKESALGRGLVKYAYAQSGFQNNLNEFFTHIPHHYLIESGIVGSVNGSLREASEAINDDEFIDQLFRHNVENDRLVPKISATKIIRTKGKGKLSGGFVYNAKKHKDLETKQDPITGIKTFPLFTKYISKSEFGTTSFLYKLQGVDANGNPVYHRTFKLGVKSNHGSIFEYKYKEVKSKSVIKENEISQVSKDQITALNNEVPNSGNALLHLNYGPSLESILREETRAGRSVYVNNVFQSIENSIPRKFDSDMNTPAQEQRGDGEIETIAAFQAKVDYFKKKMNVEVILDSDVETSRLLSSTDPRTIEAGKPVILINPNAIFSTTVIHEFAHVMIDAFPGGLKNPRLQAAIKQLQGTSIWSDTKRLYPELSDEMFQKEVLAQAIGIEGAVQWDNASEQSALMGILNWVYDYLKRTFGLSKNEVKSLTKELLSEKEFDVSGIENSIDQQQKTHSSRTAALDHQYDQISTRIANLHNAHKASALRKKDKKAGTKAFIESLGALRVEVEKLDKVDKALGMTKYVEWSTDRLKSTAEYIKKAEEHALNMNTHIKADELVKLSNFMDSFGLLRSVQEALIVDSLGLSEKDREATVKEAKEAISDYDTLQTKLLVLKKQNYAHEMAARDVEHLTAHEEAYKEEFAAVQPQGYTESQYVTEKMGENADAIREEAYFDFLNRATVSDIDVDSLSGLFAGEKNLDSPELQVISKMIDSKDRLVDDYSIEAATRMDAMHKKFLKENPGVTNKARYSKYVNQTKNGAYFVGEYKPEFIEANKEAKLNLDEEFYNEEYKSTETKGNEYKIGDKWHKFDLAKGKVNGLFYEFDAGGKMPIAQAIGKSQWLIWAEKNVTVNEDNRTVPKDIWKDNKYKSLSTEQLQTLEEFKIMSRQADVMYDGNNSLIEKYKGIEFHRLPGMTASTIERALSGNPLDAIKDMAKDATKVRIDEYEYSTKQQLDLENTKKEAGKGDKYNKAVLAGIDNREAFNVPIPFRARLDGKEQSLDIHSMMLINLVASKNYEVKTGIDDTIGVFIDVMTQRDIPQTEGMNRTQKVHAFAGDELVKIFKGKDRLHNDVKKLIEMREQRVYGIRNVGSGKAHKITGSVLKWAGSVSLIGNWAAEVVNVLTGKVSNFIEAIGGESFTYKDLVEAKKIYWQDFKNNITDLGANVQTSRTNLLNNAFNTMGDRNYLNNDFEETNRVKSLFKMNNLRALAQGGEHMMQSQVMYAILHNIKALNNKGQYLDKNGKVTSDKKSAVSLNDVIKFEKAGNGVIKMSIPSWVTATTHSLTGKGNNLTEIQDNLLNETRALIKKKIIDLHGAYDNDIQSSAQRMWWGKALFYLKKWMVPTVARRWRGATTMLRKVESLRDIDKFYSQDLKAFQEGYYVTAARFVTRTLPSAYREGGIEMVKKGYENMSKHEKANMRKMLAELSMITLTVLAYAAMGGLDDDPDEETLYARYVLRREIAELTFYMNPLETYRIAATPSAAMGFMEKNLRLLNQSFSPTERYKQGPHKDRLKWSKMAQDLIPIKAQTQRDIQSSLEFLQW